MVITPYYGAFSPGSFLNHHSNQSLQYKCNQFNRGLLHQQRAVVEIECPSPWFSFCTFYPQPYQSHAAHTHAPKETYKPVFLHHTPATEQSSIFGARHHTNPHQPNSHIGSPETTRWCSQVKHDVFSFFSGFLPRYSSIFTGIVGSIANQVRSSSSA